VFSFLTIKTFKKGHSGTLRDWHLLKMYDVRGKMDDGRWKRKEG
jgi:hypothetical protein